MEANTLMSILHNSTPVNDGYVEQLCDMARNYPYFALPQSLLAAIKTKNGSSDRLDHIAKAALMVRDRRKLQSFIGEFCAEKDIFAEKIEGENNVVQDDAKVEDKSNSNIISEQTFIIPEINLNGSREELAAGMSLLEEKKKSLDELKELIASRLQQIEDEKKKETVEQPKRKLTKAELIDKFIAENPSISRHKAEFFNPISVAQSSNRDEENIISETLAKIYANQGFFDKAISTYQNLMLKYPEKSVYFAARIEEIKENQIKQ